ncbi:MAG TPA: disulfide bond formation protein B [Alphaproteobacteria bacterium]|nr:disulfide bond formation protein B [Alphaproteobacteria bacterium]
MNTLFQPRTAFLLTLLAALGALGAALAAQFVFGLKPCIMCLWQRLPYALLIVGAVIALLKPNAAPRLFLIAFLLLFMASAFLAFFHFGIEQHWWSLENGCKVEALKAKTEAEILAEILSTPQAECDKVAWSLFGASITVWNMLFSGAMALYLGVVLLRNKNA